MALLGAITDALFRPSSRAIDIIIPDVVFEEIHRDELIITQHPVEKGAAITDHAFKRPAELEMRVGWSDSTAGYMGYARQVYDRLRRLQDERRPFPVYTGKRRYQNMLMRGLALTTDDKSEYAALVVVALQEVILTSTRTTGGQQSSNTATPGANGDQANPASTGSITNSGNVEAQGVGSQAFAGAYGPGSSLNPGTGVAAGSIGDTSIGAVGEGLSGLAAPSYTADVGQMVDESTGEVVVPGSDPTLYNPFARDPNLP